MPRKKLSHETQSDQYVLFQIANWLRENRFNGRRVDFFHANKELGVELHHSNWTLWSKAKGIPITSPLVSSLYLLALGSECEPSELSMRLADLKRLLEKYSPHLALSPKFPHEMIKLFDANPQVKPFSGPLAHLFSTCAFFPIEFDVLPSLIFFSLVTGRCDQLKATIADILAEYDNYIHFGGMLGEHTYGIYDLDGEDFVSTDCGLQPADLLDFLRSSDFEDSARKLSRKVCKLVLVNLLSEPNWSETLSQLNKWYSDIYHRFDSLSRGDSNPGIAIALNGNQVALKAAGCYHIRRLSCRGARIKGEASASEWEVELHTSSLNVRPIFRLAFCLNVASGKVEMRFINLSGETLQFAFLAVSEIAAYDFGQLEFIYRNEMYQGEVSGEKMTLFIRNDEFNQSQIAIPIEFRGLLDNVPNLAPSPQPTQP
jgi:hypothetical protein